MITRLRQLLQKHLGLDRAIAATSLTQLMRLVTGPITMVLMIRHFTPEEQGFYYSFGGVIGIQVFLEAGFAQSITQFTSKEFASLRFNSNGLLTGSLVALSRLRSLISQANRYYRSMAAVLTVCLAIGGYWFFSTKPSHGVPWSTPWFVACLSAGISFLLTPVWAFLEGCNRVAQVATYRMWSTLAMFIVTAIGLMLDFGIYVVVWGTFFSLTIPIVYIALRWRKLILQILRPPGKHTISWREDIWSFQWRIAISWITKYFTDAAIAPMSFAAGGAAAAGQVGMTLQLLRTGALVASSWSGTKLPLYGSLIAKGKINEFEQLWKTAAIRHFTFGLLIQAFLLLGLAGVSIILPDFGKRFLCVDQAILFSASYIVASILIAMLHYTRASRVDPLYLVGVLSSCVFLVGALAGSTLFGLYAIGISLFIARTFAVVASFPIWKKHREKLHGSGESISNNG